MKAQTTSGAASAKNDRRAKPRQTRAVLREDSVYEREEEFRSGRWACRNDEVARRKPWPTNEPQANHSEIRDSRYQRDTCDSDHDRVDCNEPTRELV